MSEARIRRFIRGLIAEATGLGDEAGSAARLGKLDKSKYNIPSELTTVAHEDLEVGQHYIIEPGAPVYYVSPADKETFDFTTENLTVLDLEEYAGGRPTTDTAGGLSQQFSSEWHVVRVDRAIRIKEKRKGKSRSAVIGAVKMLAKDEDNNTIYKDFPAGKFTVISFNRLKGPAMETRGGFEAAWARQSGDQPDLQKPAVRAVINQLLQPSGQRIPWQTAIDAVVAAGYVPKRRDEMTGAFLEEDIDIKKDVEPPRAAKLEGAGERLLSFIFPNLYPVGAEATTAGVDVRNADPSLGGWEAAEVKEPEFRIGAEGRVPIFQFMKRAVPLASLMAALINKATTSSEDSVSFQNSLQDLDDKVIRVLEDIGLDSCMSSSSFLAGGRIANGIQDALGNINAERAGLHRALAKEICEKYKQLKNSQETVTAEQAYDISDPKIDSARRDYVRVSRGDVASFAQQTSRSFEAGEIAVSHIGATASMIESAINNMGGFDALDAETQSLIESSDYWPEVLNKESLKDAVVSDLRDTIRGITIFGEKPVIIVSKKKGFAIVNSADLEATFKDETEELEKVLLGRITQGGQKLNLTQRFGKLKPVALDPATFLRGEAEQVDIDATLPVDEKGDLEGITVKFDIDNLGAAPEVTDDANPQAVAQPLADSLIRSAVYALLKEELTRSDKNDIERIARKQAKKYFDQQIGRAIDTELKKTFLGSRGKINQHVDDAISGRFKNADKNKDFDESVIRIAKRVLRAMNDLHYKRSNLIDNMKVPKN